MKKLYALHTSHKAQVDQDCFNIFFY